MKKLEEYVRSIPDFPEPGIIFRDVTSILSGRRRTAAGNRFHSGKTQGCGRGCDCRY